MEQLSDHNTSYTPTSLHIRPTIPVKASLLMVGIIFLGVFGAALSPNYWLAKLQPPEQPEATFTTTTQPTTPEHVAFTGLTLEGEGVLVWDVTTQQTLFSKNETEPLPLASLTKLMTALTAHELLATDTSVSINQQAIQQDGSSNLSEGERFSRQTLSDLMLLASSNDGAFALALAAGATLETDDAANAFVQAMNIRAQELGLSETYFKNPSGLDISATESGAVGTARDMTRLMEYIIEKEPDLLAHTQDLTASFFDETGSRHEVHNTNYYANTIPGLIGSKTGYTDLAGGNLVVAFDAGLNRPVIITVLGSTREGRFRDVQTLVEETIHYTQSSH